MAASASPVNNDDEEAKVEAANTNRKRKTEEGKDNAHSIAAAASAVNNDNEEAKAANTNSKRKAEEGKAKRLGNLWRGGKGKPKLVDNYTETTRGQALTGMLSDNK